MKILDIYFNECAKALISKIKETKIKPIILIYLKNAIIF